MRYSDLNEASSAVLKEAASKTFVFTLGRFNPPTKGHEELIKEVAKIAKKEGKADFMIYPTKSFDAKRNPLIFTQKIKYLRKALPSGVKASNIGTDPDVKNAFGAAYKALEKSDKVIMVVGGDRVSDFEKSIIPWAKKKFPDKEMVVVSSGERKAGVSASDMRQAATDNDFEKFNGGTMSGLKTTDVKKLFDDVRKGMKLEEQIEKNFPQGQHQLIREACHNQIEADSGNGYIPEPYDVVFQRLKLHIV